MSYDAIKPEARVHVPRPEGYPDYRVSWWMLFGSALLWGVPIVIAYIAGRLHG